MFWTILVSLAPMLPLAAAIGAGLAGWGRLDRSLRMVWAAALLALLSTLLIEGLRASHLHNVRVANLYGLSLGLWPVAMGLRGPRLRSGFMIAAAGLAGLWGFFMVRAGTLRVFNGPALSACNFVVLCCVLADLAAMLLARRGPLRREPWFWVHVHLLIYMPAILILLALSNQLFKAGLHYFRIAWTFNAAVSFVAYLVLWRGFKCQTRA
ncbi:MAG: hypothetical protein IPQ13_10470 [Holophagaceae bacterium]|nr:hypothetical protein [Holophagaceae bacterium]